MEFSRQEYWSGLPFRSPGDLPNPGIKPRSPELQADSLSSAPTGKPYEYMKVKVLDAQSCPTPWAVASQAPLSMGFSRQGYWSGLPCRPPGRLPRTSQADCSPSEPYARVLFRGLHSLLPSAEPQSPVRDTLSWMPLLSCLSQTASRSSSRSRNCSITVRQPHRALSGDRPVSCR